MLTQYHTYLYGFEVFIDKLQINLKKAKLISIVWRKGKKSVQTECSNKLGRNCIIFNETLSLNLKLYKEQGRQEYQPKFTTFSIFQHDGQRKRVIGEARLNLLESLSGPRQFKLNMMDKGTQTSRLYLKCKSQFIMELNQFRFNNQQIEESDSQHYSTVYEKSEKFASESKQQPPQEDKAALRRELQDMTYLNTKLKNDREKLLLRVREVEFEYKQKQKLLVKQIRQAKNFFEKKIKIRQDLYEEEMQRLVFQFNQEQVKVRQYQQHLLEQLQEERQKYNKKYTQLKQMKEDTIKLNYQLEQMTMNAKILEQDKLRQQKIFNEQKIRLENEIAALNKEVIHFQERLGKQIKAKQQQQDAKKRINTQFQQIMKQMNEKNYKLSEFQILLHKKDEQLRELDFKVETFQNKIISHQLTIKKLDNSNNIKDQQIFKINLELKEKISQFQSLKTQLRDVEDMLGTRSQNESVKIEERIKNLSSDKQQITDKLSSVIEELQKYKRMHHQANKRADDAQLQLKFKKDQLRSKQQKFKVKENEMEITINQIHSQLKKVQQDAFRLRQQNDELSNQKDQILLSMKKSDVMYQTQKERVNKKQIQFINLKKLLDQESTLKIRYQAHIKQLQEEISRIMNDMEFKEMTFNNNEAELKKVRKMAQNAQAIFNQKINKLQKQIQDMEEQQAKMYAKEVQLQQLKGEMEKKDSILKKIEQKNTYLLSKLKSASKGVNQIENFDEMQSVILNQDRSFSYGNQSMIQDNFMVENMKLKAEIDQMKNQIQKQKQKNLRMIKQKDLMIKQLQQKNHQILQNMMDAAKNSSSFDSDNKNLFEKFKQKDVIINSLQKQLALRREENQQYVTQIKKKQVKIDELQVQSEAKVRTMMQKLSQSKLDGLDFSKQDIQKNIFLREKQMIQNMNLENEKDVLKLKEEIKKKDMKLAQLQNKIQQLKSQVQSLQNNNANSNPKNQKSLMRKESRNVNSAINKQEFQRLQQENLRMTRHIKYLQEQLAQLEEPKMQEAYSVEVEEQPKFEDSFAMPKKGDEEHNKQSTQKNQKKLKHTISQLQKRIRDYEEQINDRQKTIQSLQKDLDQRKKNKKGSTNTAERGNIAERSNIAELEKKLKDYQVSVPELEKKIKMLQTTISDLQSKIKDLEMDAKFKQRQYKLKEDALNLDINNRKDMQSRITQEIKEKTKKIDKIQDELKQLNLKMLNESVQFQKLKYILETRELEIKRLKQQNQKQFRKQSGILKKNQQLQMKSLREVMQLRENDYKLRKQIQKLSQEKKVNNFKLEELQKGMKDKLKEIEVLQKQIQELQQLKVKLDYMLNTQETQSEDFKKKLSKATEEFRSSLQDKQNQIKILRKRILASDKNEQEYENKINLIQEKSKMVINDNQKSIQEINKRLLLQIKENHALKEQNQIVLDEVRALKKRIQQAQRHYHDLEDRFNIVSRNLDQVKRASQKHLKESEQKQDKILKINQQNKRITEQLRKAGIIRQDAQKQKRKLQDQLHRLERIINGNQTQLKRLNRQIQRNKSRFNDNQQDQFSNQKTTRLNLQRSEDARRKLEKNLEQKQIELKNLNNKCRKLQQQRKNSVQELTSSYTDKLGVYVNQIENIKKLVKDYEEEIVFLKNENRQVKQQYDRQIYKISNIQNDFKLALDDLDSKTSDLLQKKEQVERIKQQKFEQEIQNSNLIKENTIIVNQNKKSLEKITKLSQINLKITEDYEKLEMELRIMKNSLNQAQFDKNTFRVWEQKYKDLQSINKEIAKQREQLLKQLKRRSEYQYTRDDLIKLQNDLTVRHKREKEIQLTNLISISKEEYENKIKSIEYEMVQSLNELSKIRSELELVKQHNSTLVNENMRYLQHQKQQKLVNKRLQQVENIVVQKDSHIKQYQKEREKQSNIIKELNSKISQLEKVIENGNKVRFQYEKELQKQKRIYEESNDQIKKLEQKSHQSIKKNNQELKNRILQLQFEIARLKQNENALQDTYQKKLMELERQENERVRDMESQYYNNVSRYDAEINRLKNILEDLNYVIQEKNHEIYFAKEESTHYQNQIVSLKQQMDKARLKYSQEKETYSLELFKINNKLKDTEQQWQLRVKRLEDELGKVSGQLVAATSRVQKDLSHSKLRGQQGNQQRQVRKLEQKLRLKQKTIQQLKQKVFSMQEEIYRVSQDRQSVKSSSVNIRLIKQENQKLKEELQSIQLKSSVNSVIANKESQKQEQINSLNQIIENQKKQINKYKRIQEQLKDTIDQIKLKIDSMSSEISFLKGYETSYRELKIQYEKINNQLRLKNNQTTTDLERMNEVLNQEKNQLEEKIKQLQARLEQLTEWRLKHEVMRRNEKTEQLQANNTLKLRQAMTQYKQQLGKREQFFKQQCQSLKQKLNVSQQKLKKLEGTNMLLNRQLKQLNQTNAQLTNQNSKLNEQIFKINSNLIKDEFQKLNDYQWIKEKWNKFQHILKNLVGIEPEEDGLSYIQELIYNYKNAEQTIENLKNQLQEARNKLVWLKNEKEKLAADLMQKFKIRQEQFKFEEQRHQLDLESLNRETDRLQLRVEELELMNQQKQNLQIEFQKLQYDYNNCKIMLENYKNEVDQLRSGKMQDLQNLLYNDTN